MNFRWSVLVVTFLCLTNLNAQQLTEIRCVLSAPGKSLSLFHFNGFGFDKIDETELIEDSVFVFQVPTSADRYFIYLGPQSNNAGAILIGQEEQITIRGSYNAMRSAQVEDSPLNKEYRRVREKIYRLNRDLQTQNNIMRVANKDPEKAEVVKKAMGSIDEKRLALLKELEGSDPYFARIAAINTYLSFYNYGNAYNSEVMYFANEYFAYTDLSDPGYNDLPWVFEAFKGYATTLSGIGLSQDKHSQFLEAQLAQIPSPSSAHRYAMSGALAAMQQKNHANFVPFARAYLKQYANDVPVATTAYEKQIKAMASFVVGGEAPDFSAATPEGGELSLSDLRGKIVLVDFWASWCGPCRRENPNVKRVYDTYKDQGFEILGVSLDRTKDRWLKAIEQDGLPWPHISDLQGWNSAPAKLYGVRSIPHTVLLDKEGRIIARGLRGPALEQKLAEIFKS